MTTTQMNPDLATLVRAALVDHVTAAPAVRRRRRWHRAAGAGIGLVLVGGGVAVAQGVLTLPGADRVTHLATAVIVTRTGTGTVDLGDPPAGATSIEVQLTCLTPRVFTWQDGAAMHCGIRDVADGGSTGGYTLPLQPGQHSTAITTDRTDARWRLTATYSQRVPTGWATNAAGDTYGIIHDHGEPDPIAVTATNGEDGYAYATSSRVRCRPHPSRRLSGGPRTPARPTPSPSTPATARRRSGSSSSRASPALATPHHSRPRPAGSRSSSVAGRRPFSARATPGQVGCVTGRTRAVMGDLSTRRPSFAGGTCGRTPGGPRSRVAARLTRKVLLDLARSSTVVADRRCPDLDPAEGADVVSRVATSGRWSPARARACEHPISVDGFRTVDPRGVPVRR